MPDTVVKTIVGTCGEISERNGWTTFHVNDGREWPTKLATKLEKIIEEGRAVGTQTATWTYKERESDEINEKSGKPFVNRYLDKVELGEHAPAETPNTGSTAAPERPQAGEHAPLAVGDRERAIVRQTCLKAAATLFSGVGNTEVVGEGVRDNVSELLAVAARLERWVMRDLTDVPFE